MNSPWAKVMLAALLALASEVGAGGDRVPTGTWQGGGRACAGRLDITRHALTWRTTFSRCLRVPFKSSDLGEKSGSGRTLFTLERAAPSCPFASVELRYQEDPEHWEVIGHRSEAERQAGRLDNALACPLVRIK